jgi:hypothetical protein
MEQIALRHPRYLLLEQEGGLSGTIFPPAVWPLYSPGAKSHRFFSQDKSSTNNEQRTSTIRRNTMSDQENRNPQHNDSQKPAQDSKPESQPTSPVQQIPTVQPKTPQPEQEKHDQGQRKQA